MHSTTQHNPRSDSIPEPPPSCKGPADLPQIPRSRSPVEDLLIGMRSGDRLAAAEFIDRFGERIRRRIRGKLAPEMRRIFDSQEVLSTVGRRLDQFVGSGQMMAASEAQLWSLVFRITENALIDKARIFRRLKSTEAEDSPFAQHFLGRLNEAESYSAVGGEMVIDRALRALSDPIDRQILALWLSDTPHSVTADCLGMSSSSVRQRWGRIKTKLQKMLEPE